MALTSVGPQMKSALATAVAAMALLTTVGLVRAEPSVGWLDVASDPPAEIFIDDADAKLVTPQMHLPLQAGHHTLKLVAAGGKQSKIGFSVAAGKTTSLSMQPR